MGGHDTWFSYLPGYFNLQEYAAHYLHREAVVRSWPGWARQIVTVAFGSQTSFSLAHVCIALFVALLLTALALRFAWLLRRSNGERLLPANRFGVRNFFELVIEATLGIAEGVMGRHNAERFLPLIGSYVFFILCNNVIGLVPGFLPPTDTLKTNLALSLLVLLVTIGVGFKEQGFGYLKHFVGPVWYVAPLILVIELISQLLVRPLSLAIRLMGNMFADHTLLGTIQRLSVPLALFVVPVLFPLPFYVLGLLVCVVQTLVFSLLGMIYIGEAAAHEAH